MPTYTIECVTGHRTEQFLTLAQYEYLEAHQSIRCACGNIGRIVITPPLLVAAQPECRYDSPIDGTPITSWAARRNDLAKHGCRPYDPEQKTDRLTQLKESEASLDKAVEEHVEASIAKMSTRERGKLQSELLDQGMDAAVVRRTYGG